MRTTNVRRLCLRLGLSALASAWLLAPCLVAQPPGAILVECTDFVSSDAFEFKSWRDTSVLFPGSPDCNCPGCSTPSGPGYWCYRPDLSGALYELDPPDCDPHVEACGVKAMVRARYRGNSRSIITAAGGGDLFWTNSSGSTVVGHCGGMGQEIFTEEAEFYTTRTGFTCGSSGGAVTGLSAEICEGSTDCQKAQ